jgi:integrase
VFYLEESDVEQLIEAADGFHDTLIIRLLVSTGMRRSEVISLRCQDVDIEGKKIHIYERKNDEYRTVGFRSDKLARDLRMWFDHYRQQQYGAEESDYLFPPDGRGESDHLGETVVRDIVVEAAERAGIQQSYGKDALGREQHLVTPHALRATFAVQCAKNGVPAPMVKEALGHHDLSVTDIYTSVIDDDAADMITEAIVDRPKRVATKLGTFAEIMYAVSPTLTDSILNLAYRLFPSTEPGDMEDPEEELSPESVAFAYLMKGIHW